MWTTFVRHVSQLLLLLYRLPLFSLFAFGFYHRQVVRVLSIHEGNRTAVSRPPENELIPANLLRSFDNVFKFHEILQFAFRSTNDDGAFFKAALLSGPP